MGRQSSRDSQAICRVTIRAGLRAACGLLCQAYHELGKYVSIFLFRHLFISVFLKDFLDDAFSTQWEVELLEMGKRYAPWANHTLYLRSSFQIINSVFLKSDFFFSTSQAIL